MALEAFKEHLTLLKTRGVNTLSIPPEKGQLLRAILTAGATNNVPSPEVTITKVAVVGNKSGQPVSVGGTGGAAPSFKSFATTSESNIELSNVSNSGYIEVEVRK